MLVQLLQYRILSLNHIVPVLPDDDSEREPPDPISNSEVKPLSADGSVGSPHVRVGHRQALIPNPVVHRATGFFMGKQKPPLTSGAR